MSSGTQSAQGEYLEYGEFLAQQLRQTRTRIKLIDIVSGLTVIGVAAVSYVMTVIVLDQLLVLSTAMRVGLLLCFALVTGAYLAYAIVVPAVRRINLLFAARTVEQANPLHQEQHPQLAVVARPQPRDSSVGDEGH